LRQGLSVPTLSVPTSDVQPQKSIKWPQTLQHKEAQNFPVRFPKARGVINISVCPADQTLNYKCTLSPYSELFTLPSVSAGSVEFMLSHLQFALREKLSPCTVGLSSLFSSSPHTCTHCIIILIIQIGAEFTPVIIVKTSSNLKWILVHWTWHSSSTEF